METEPNFFADLAMEIDWDTQFQEAGAELFQQLATGETGQETTQKITNLFQMAEHQANFVSLQRLASQMIAQCCASPHFAAEVQANPYLRNLLAAEAHKDCKDHDNEEEEAEDEDEAVPTLASIILKTAIPRRKSLLFTKQGLVAILS